MLLEYTFTVAVRAFHGMYVVRALGRFEGRIHVFHVEAAIGEARMASSAGRPRVHAMIFMAGEATGENRDRLNSVFSQPGFPNPVIGGHPISQN